MPRSIKSSRENDRLLSAGFVTVILEDINNAEGHSGYYLQESTWTYAGGQTTVM